MHPMVLSRTLLASSTGSALALGLLLSGAPPSAPTTAAVTTAIPSGAASPSGLRSAAPVQEYDKFRKEFEQAMTLGSKSKMDNLLRDMEIEAIYSIVSTAEIISNAPNDILYDRFNGYRDSWNRVHETEFPDKMERYFANLTSTMKNDRRKVRTEYEKLGKLSYTAQQEKDLTALLAISARYVNVAEGFKDLGDMWYESQARMGAGVIADETFHKKKTDFNRVTAQYERAAFLREELGVKDKPYKQLIPRMRTLIGLGFGSGANGGGGGGDDPAAPSAKPEAAGEVLTSKMEYEELDEMKPGSRPSYYLDDHIQIWPSIDLGGVDSTATFQSIEEGPTIKRTGASKVGFDSTGDGEADMEWPTRGKREVVTFDIGSGASKRKYSVLTDIGRAQDFYQGQQFNLAPTDSQFRLYCVPMGSMVGELSGEKVQIVDDNFDGVYGSMPMEWKHFGMKLDTLQMEFDSVFVGSEKKAQPFGEYISLGKAGWHKVETLNGGTEITAEPVTFKTGTLQVKVKGLKPEYVIVQGTGGVLGQTFIDISGGKKVDVPIGRWNLAFGLIREGKKMQTIKCVMLPGSGTPSYDVTEGENVEVTLGAPFAFEFDVQKSASSATVTGSSVQVVGAGGELYDRFYGVVPRPTAEIRKTGTKRAFDNVKMRPAESQDDIAKLGWPAAWKPQDAELSARGEDDEVMLSEKKNKLFGKIASTWR